VVVMENISSAAVMEETVNYEAVIEEITYQ
jgi:hypothetical protein